MRLVTWIVRALVFLALFVFALNNQHDGTVRWFFGHEWRAPMVFIVLAAFGAGCAAGVAAMLPSWWKHRRVAQRLPPKPFDPPATLTTPRAADLQTVGPDVLDHPPRDGL